CYSTRIVQLTIQSRESEMLSSDHLVRAVQHRLRNRQPDLSRRLQVDHKLKLRRLLHRQISRLGAFQDLVHVNSRALMEVSVVLTVGHEAALIDKFLLKINSW